VVLGENKHRPCDRVSWIPAFSEGKRRGSVLGVQIAIPEPMPIDRDCRPGHIVGQIGRKELDPHFDAILDRPKPRRATNSALSRLP